MRSPAYAFTWTTTVWLMPSLSGPRLQVGRLLEVARGDHLDRIQRHAQFMEQARR